MKEKVKYCEYCGKKCTIGLVGAETVIVYYGLDTTGVLASKYDRKTGKRNYARQFICPDYKVKKWFQVFSPHTNYEEEKVINI